MRAHTVAFRAGLAYVLYAGEFDLDDLIEFVHRAAGTTHIAPGRTIKDWVLDAAELGTLEKIGYDRFRVVDRNRVFSLLAEE